MLEGIKTEIERRILDLKNSLESCKEEHLKGIQFTIREFRSLKVYLEETYKCEKKGRNDF